MLIYAHFKKAHDTLSCQMMILLYMYRRDDRWGTEWDGEWLQLKLTRTLLTEVVPLISKKGTRKRLAITVEERLVKMLHLSATGLWLGLHSIFIAIHDNWYNRSSIGCGICEISWIKCWGLIQKSHMKPDLGS